MIPLTQAANQGRFASGASNSSSGLSHRNCGYFHARFPGVPPMAGGRVIKRKLNNRACLDKFEPPAARAGRQSLPSGVLLRHLEGLHSLRRGSGLRHLSDVLRVYWKTFIAVA